MDTPISLLLEKVAEEAKGGKACFVTESYVKLQTEYFKSKGKITEAERVKVLSKFDKKEEIQDIEEVINKKSVK